MREIVFLLEEASAKAMLENFLPRILSSDINTRMIPFEGKQDLEKQLVRRLRGYTNQHARFIILRDQDNHPDCKALKASLFEKCREAAKETVCTVRIACRELETFYLADLSAVERGLNIENLIKHQNKAKFRDPDRLGSPSKELANLIKAPYSKVSGSRQIAQYLNPDNARSPSFRNLVSAVRRYQHDLLALIEE
jgi:hypothetical protein